LKRLIVAISFLTRIPIPPNLIFEAKDVGRAALVFPLVGALLGSIQIFFLKAFEFGGSAPNSSLKAILAAILLVIVGALATGALHFDGLADMADGFGGGRDKESVLRIMRDSVIGTYGAAALILLIALKVTAIAALIETGSVWRFLIVAPVFGRWATVPLGKFMPYARASGGLGASVTDYVGWTELVGASVIAMIFTFALLDWRSGLICWSIVIFLTAFNARMCAKKIGGVTGDTMGANTEISETAVLLAAAFFATN
jgi:cobalamin 5'-phosphate synthase/cobalamin synthase